MRVSFGRPDIAGRSLAALLMPKKPQDDPSEPASVQTVAAWLPHVAHGRRRKPPNDGRFLRNRQLACKPGSVWRSPSATAIHLGPGSLPRLEQPTRAAAWIMPDRRACAQRPCRPYSVLLPVGFAVPPPLPDARCALTAPFHPCPCRSPCAGGLFSVALSLGSPPAAVSRHRRSLEPGLSSTGRVWPQSLFTRQRPSGQLAPGIRGLAGARSRGRLEAAKWRGLLEGAAGAQHQRIGADRADHLQADRQARLRDAAGDRGRRLGGQVEEV